MAVIHVLPNNPGSKPIPVELTKPLYAFDNVDYLGLFNKDDQVIYVRFRAGLNQQSYETGLADKCSDYQKVEFAELLKDRQFGRLRKIPKDKWLAAWHEFKKRIHLINTVD